MATFTKLKSGKTRAQVRMASHYASKTFHTKAQAVNWARTIEIQIQDGEYASNKQASNTPTLRDVIGSYQRRYTSQKKSAGNEHYIFNIFLKHPIVSMQINEISARDIKDLRDSMLNEYENGGSVRRYLSTLRHVFTKAVKEWEFITKNPFDSVELPKYSNSRERRVENHEIEQLLKEASKHRNKEIHTILVLAIDTGMRQGEILKLRWADYMPEKLYIVARDTKNGETRGIPLSSVALSEIEKLPKVDDKLFHYTIDGFKTSWSKLVKKTGIVGLNFHDLRHEATSRFFERGFDTMEVAAITGHKDLKMLSRYTHLKADRLARKLTSNLDGMPGFGNAVSDAS